MKTAKFKDSPLGPIPHDWEVKTIAEFGQVVTGSTPPRGDKDNWNGDFPWISAQDFGGKYIRESVENISEKGKKFCRLLPADSVLVTCIASIGLNAIVKIECATNQQINAVICEKGSPDFLYYTMEFNKARFLTLAGQTAVPIINKGQFETFTVPYPPLEEQQRIAEALGEVDKLIESLDEQIEKKRLIAKGVAHDLLSGKKHLPGFEPVGERMQDRGYDSSLPEGWVMKRLGDAAKINRGGSPRPIESWLTTSADGINWIKIGDVAEGAKYICSTAERILPEAAQFSRAVKPGDFLLSNSMSFGRPYILKIAGCIHDGWLTIQDYKDTFDCEYLYYILGSEAVFKQYIALADGSSVKNLNKDKVEKVLVPCPSLAEQQAIADLLSEQDAAIAVLEEKREKYARIKEGMMRDLLTGKVRMKGECDDK